MKFIRRRLNKGGVPHLLAKLILGKALLRSLFIHSILWIRQCYFNISGNN